VAGLVGLGLYFAHPESHYFGVGKIERDQVEDYARRKGWTLEEAERWLAPILENDRGEETKGHDRHHGGNRGCKFHRKLLSDWRGPF
jgi:hypothetical protein